MSPSREQPQHPGSIRLIPWFAQDFPANHDNCVGSQHQIVRSLVKHGQRLLPR
jgi:hypothetical protein